MIVTGFSFKKKKLVSESSDSLSLLLTTMCCLRMCDDMAIGIRETFYNDGWLPKYWCEFCFVFFCIGY